MKVGITPAARRATLVALGAAVVAAVAGAFVVRQHAVEERLLLEERATTLANALESSLSEAMGEHRPESMRVILAAVGRTEGIVGVALTDRRGLVRHGAGKVPSLVEPPRSDAFTWTPERLTLARPVENARSCRRCHGDEAAVNGALYVALDASTLSPRLTRTARVVTALAAFAVLATLAAAHLVLRARAQAAQARALTLATLTRLQAIVDSMADGVIFIDAEDRVALVNEAGRALRNLSGGPGRPLRECHPQASYPMLERVLRWLREGNDPGPNHSIIKEKEGRWETTYAPVRAPGGAYLGVVMVIRDIAARRNLERRLLDAERLAAVGQMSAQVAHELRNPLNAITGAAQYLRRILPQHAEVKEYAELIDDEVRRVNHFVDELLKVARPANPVFTASGVNKVLTEAARRAALARGLDADAVRLDLVKGLPVLDLDQEMIMEAIVNLLDNAFDAGGTEPPELASSFEATGGEGSVVVQVRDRGCGIAADQLEEVTRPFVTTKARGTGLGLVIVQRAVEQHRAGFALAQRDGGGTVATLRFPVRTVRTGPVLAEVETP
jgi:PAS domain S-box-containing protein